MNVRCTVSSGWREMRNFHKWQVREGPSSAQTSVTLPHSTFLSHFVSSSSLRGFARRYSLSCKMDSHKSEDALVAAPPHATENCPMTEAEADAQAVAIDVPDDTGEGGRLRMIVQLVKRSFGVKDLAAMWALFSNIFLGSLSHSYPSLSTSQRLSFACAGVSRYQLRYSNQCQTLNTGTT
jgi:hypothetical protein